MALFFRLVMNSNGIKKKSLLNYHIQYRVSVLFLISIPLVSIPYLLSPLAYSQEFKTGEANLSSPTGIAVNSSSGNVYVYVADTANNRIQVFTANGTYITKWGKYGGPSGNGTFNQPTGIAVDPLSGNVYVADTANNRIQVFSNSTIRQ